MRAETRGAGGDAVPQSQTAVLTRKVSRYRFLALLCGDPGPRPGGAGGAPRSAAGFRSNCHHNVTARQASHGARPTRRAEASTPAMD